MGASSVSSGGVLAFTRHRVWHIMVSSSYHLSCSEDITIPGGILVSCFTIASISRRYAISVEQLFPCDCNRTLLGCTVVLGSVRRVFLFL